ncbi:uncharacterized protein Dana_GF19536 [Drosophila ananassae]|uniref:Uncharacterized protein n=1 Tax=Drosophila ananassae TaxID=7217 RepID=B3MXX7_DROAN|nr:uncharacterized protein LOC6502293 [Drosophila ananassae]EDV38592.1 uncharacterized protein Dana_GF19536 [Drosophila ananassae]
MPVSFRPTGLAGFWATSVRLFFSALYLWLLMHAAAIVAIPIERYDSKEWSNYLTFDISYRTLLGFDLKAELYITTLMGSLLYTLCRCCRRNMDRPIVLNYRIYIFLAPYLLSFIVYWTISTGIISYGLFRIVYHSQNNLWIIITQFILGILFKLLIFSNYYSTCVRSRAILKVLETEGPEREAILNLRTHATHLNFFFRL